MMESDRNDVAQLPAAFIDRLRRIIPEHALGGVLDSFTQPPAVGFRVNTLRAEPEPVLESLRNAGLQPRSVVWWEYAFWLPHADRAALLASEAYREAWIYVQNLSSMIPPLVLAPRAGERVLDLAAAPGSKTLQIACLMQGEGELAAVEVVRPRFFKLRDNLNRQGADHVRAFLQNGERVWRYRPEYFDRILLDAPCSSEGRFSAADPDSYRYWSPRKIGEMARKQRRLLYSAVRSLRPGGRLVYSTCSFSPEENEGAVSHVLDKFDGVLEVEPIDIDLDNRATPLARWGGQEFAEDIRHAMRILPDEKMEGFFVCSLRKLD